MPGDVCGDVVRGAGESDGAWIDGAAHTRRAWVLKKDKVTVRIVEGEGGLRAIIAGPKRGSGLDTSVGRGTRALEVHEAFAQRSDTDVSGRYTGTREPR
jgi:hypothetical protein